MFWEWKKPNCREKMDVGASAEEHWQTQSLPLPDLPCILTIPDIQSLVQSAVLPWESEKCLENDRGSSSTSLHSLKEARLVTCNYWVGLTSRHRISDREYGLPCLLGSLFAICPYHYAPLSLVQLSKQMHIVLPSPFFVGIIYGEA